ncbi:MAG TPA: Spy/CpxP family protein refolding chaperone [Gemmatimonadales bacterium]|nr:Spy/CpxP family protein refolding chaperone [Gemmatimonadales bacterium]
MKQGMRMLGLLAFLAVPLSAQQPASPDSAHRHGGMMGPGGPGMMGHDDMMGPGMGMMMGGMEYAPAHLLAMNGELSLTAQQITALTALRDAAKRDGQASMDRIKTHMDELRTALDAAAPDTVAIRTHFLAAHEAMGQAHLAMLITNARAKALLTDAQRAQIAQMRHGMMEGRRRGGPGRWHGQPAMRMRGS